MIKNLYNWLKEKIVWFFIGGVVLAATALPQTASVNELVVLEDTYFSKHGKYLQIIPDDRLPHYEAGTVVEKLGKHAPPQAAVHIYEQADKQKGYQIIYQTSTSTNSVGFGPQAKERTSVVPKPQEAASSTPVSLKKKIFFLTFGSAQYAYALAKSANFVRASSQYLSIDDNASLSNTGDVTIEAWVRFTDVPSGDEIRMIAAKGDLATVAGTSYVFMFRRDVGTNYLWAQTGNGSNVDNESVAWTPTTATWYHVAWVFTSSTSKYQFFVDGSQQGADQTGANTSITNNATRFTLGAYDVSGSGGNGAFNGDIVTVRVWETARTGTQINDNKCTVLGATASLDAEWTLDDVLTDNSGSGNTLTNNNSVTFTTALPDCFASAAGSIFSPWQMDIF